MLRFQKLHRAVSRNVRIRITPENESPIVAPVRPLAYLRLRPDLGGGKQLCEDNWLGNKKPYAGPTVTRVEEVILTRAGWCVTLDGFEDYTPSGRRLTRRFPFPDLMFEIVDADEAMRIWRSENAPDRTPSLAVNWDGSPLGGLPNRA